MPRRRAVWASWNYLARDRAAARSGAVAVTYWMNRLQNLDPAVPLFVTLNPPVEPDAALVHGVFDYEHPMYDLAAMRAQAEIATIQGPRRTWFAGAWLYFIFREGRLYWLMARAAAISLVFLASPV